MFIEGTTSNITKTLVDHLTVVKTLSRSNSVTVVSCDNMVAPPGGCVDATVEGVCRVHMRLKVSCFEVAPVSTVYKNDVGIHCRRFTRIENIHIHTNSIQILTL